MSSPRPFELARRQPYLTEVAYHNTVKWHADEEPLWNENLERAGEDPERLSSVLRSLAHLAWSDFQMGYTAGLDIETLSGKLEATVAAYERYADVYDLLPDEKYDAPIVLNSLVDVYVDYLNMFSAAVLLHRHDLVPRIHALNAGTSHDRCDAIIEELLSFFIPGRPMLDEMEWGATYGKLIEAIDAGTPAKRVTRMRHYVRRWYPSMRRACFYGKHEEIKDDYSPYIGYWAFCAGAFSYLYGIDDSSYRDELVYPKDLVDYARSRPREPVVLDDGSLLLRVGGGQPCPRAGLWFVPWVADSDRRFALGEPLPLVSGEGLRGAIWEWDPEA